ncbi:TetR family transcriptional regulator [Saccharopolyspora sp. K220]|uniref:TetR/AcrR family transcriptional regulator n=1 Tax=Saccharopolyspora soli TaxID=2926618 RepID=UPI001F596673|nr:TetR family transcriptional regulator [Saccharopolyspora soli]MCI2422975.1 TetR family transcriptional regulator [Saccharopolyspora soli]
MRPSSRNLILDAAIRVTERAGITGLTLESTAEEAGVTKGGLLYHFHTRDELLMAIQQHLAAAWEERLTAALGKPLAEASVRESTAAYAQVCADDVATKADLAFMVESANHPQLAQVWNDLMNRWAPMPTSAERADIELLLVRMAASGLWLCKATSGSPPSKPMKKALRKRLAQLTEVDHADPA